MAKRKTDEELLQELSLFNHHEAARRFLQLMEAARPKPQRQCSLEDQLNELDALAAQNGLYDAQDFMRTVRRK